MDYSSCKKMNVPSLDEIGFKISKMLWKEIVKYYGSISAGVIPRGFPIEAFAWQRLRTAKAQFSRINSLNIPKNAICLDSGCGIGALLILANKAGYNFYGYDVDEKAVTIAHSLSKYNNLSAKRVRLNKGTIPFNKKFDLVTSFEVAEHVNNLDKYIYQLSKMINEQGSIFIETPNYLVPYEPHYYLFLPPVPKEIKWLIFRLIGRGNHKFFNELNFVTPRDFERTFQKNGLKWENLGIDQWCKQILKKNTANRSHYFSLFSKFVEFTKTEFAVKYLAERGFYTPQIYIARK